MRMSRSLTKRKKKKESLKRKRIIRHDLLEDLKTFLEKGGRGECRNIGGLRGTRGWRRSLHVCSGKKEKARLGSGD